MYINAHTGLNVHHHCMHTNAIDPVNQTHLELLCDMAVLLLKSHHRTILLCESMFLRVDLGSAQ